MQICLKQKMAGLLGAAYFPRKIRQLDLCCVIWICEGRLHIFRVFEKKKPEVHKCSFPGFGLGPVALCRGWILADSAPWTGLTFLNNCREVVYFQRNRRLFSGWRTFGIMSSWNDGVAKLLAPLLPRLHQAPKDHKANYRVDCWAKGEWL